MDNTYFIFGVVLVLVICGAIIGLVIVSRKRTLRLQNQFGSEYDHTVKAMGGKRKGQDELDKRQKHMQTMDIRPLTDIEKKRYLSDWGALQARFVDEPGQTIMDADHLIIEVMQLRAYPLSDFEQRAADVSVNYPGLVNYYRAAKDIANKYEQHQADTEELRQAFIYFRSLFDELLENSKVPEAV